MRAILGKILCRFFGHTPVYPWLSGEPAPRRVCFYCGANLADWWPK